MRDRRIMINSINLVKDFVYRASKVNESVYLTPEDKEYLISGKSIMGVFSLDLTKPIIVRSESNDEEFKRYLKEIEV